MVKNIYAIRDIKTHWLDPFVEESDAAARRGFGYCISNGDGLFGFTPGDFSLFKIGSYDTQSAKIEFHLPEFVCDGLDFLDAGD